MTNTDPLDALTNAVVAAHDPIERFAAAVSAAWNGSAVRADSRGEAGKIHAERHPGGVLLRLSDVQGGRSVEVVLPAADARDLGRYLNAAR